MSEPRDRLTDDLTPWLAALFTLAVLAVAYAAGRFELTVYGLSFWHYLVYALAFFWRRVAVSRFKRDSLLLKALSFAALAYVFWLTIPNLWSILVMALGFGLNTAAALRLGTDRTYYGYELGALPPKWITGFPYSHVPHPMLLGNIVAYAGMLLDPQFRADWWALGLAHVVLNAAVLLMEMKGAESRRQGTVWPLFVLLLGALLLLLGFAGSWLAALAVIALSLAFATILSRSYVTMTGREEDLERLS